MNQQTQIEEGSRRSAFLLFYGRSILIECSTLAGLFPEVLSLRCVENRKGARAPKPQGFIGDTVGIPIKWSMT